MSVDRVNTSANRPSFAARAVTPWGIHWVFAWMPVPGSTSTIASACSREIETQRPESLTNARIIVAHTLRRAGATEILHAEEIDGMVCVSSMQYQNKTALVLGALAVAGTIGIAKDGRIVSRVSGSSIPVDGL